jgi:hypothetical protein
MWCTASRVGTQINVISRRVRKAVNGNVHTNYPQTKIRWANKDQALADDAHIILLFYMFLPMMRLPEILGTVQGCTDYLRVVVPRGGGATIIAANQQRRCEHSDFRQPQTCDPTCGNVALETYGCWSFRSKAHTIRPIGHRSISVILFVVRRKSGGVKGEATTCIDGRW